MSASLDPTLYTRTPAFRLSGGITLAHALMDACPKAAPDNVKKACKKLRTVADRARDILAERSREIGLLSDEEFRAIDREADASWAALHLRFRAYAMLPVERFPLAKRASELDTRLFGVDGLEFLKADYASQYTAMERILKHIDDSKLQKDIDIIAGPEFLRQIRAVMPRYRAMVKEKLGRDDASGQNLVEHVRALQGAIVEYTTKIAAMVDDDEPESIRVVQSALHPIEAHRQSRAPALPDDIEIA